MNEENTEAWAWVLGNHSLIRATTWKETKRTPFEYEDIRSALIIRIVEKFKCFDPSKGTAKTWLYWQVKAVSSGMKVSHKRNNHELIEADVADPRNTYSSIVASAELLFIKPLATKAEWEAVFAKAEGLTEKETQERLGVTPFSARKRVARLANKIQRRA